MERREQVPQMPTSGSAPYYMQRGMQELHGQQQGIRSMPDPNMPFHSNIRGGSASVPTLVVEPSSTTMLSDGMGVVGVSMQQTPPVRRKRGRPRKYGPDGKVSLGVSSTLAPSRVMNSTTEKRGRGRPPGSGRKHQSGYFGELVSGSAGGGFTPHVIAVSAGEDISVKLLEFMQQGPRAMCILSANGAVSTAILRQPSTSGGTVTYEGRFDILCMSGSFLLVGNDNFQNRSGGLSISLASPDGRVIGGGVGGSLIAASPVQIIVGSFTWTNSKPKPKMGKETQVGEHIQHFSMENTMAAPPSGGGGGGGGRQSQNLSATSSMSGWGSPQSGVMRSSHVDIDLMRG